MHLKDFLRDPFCTQHTFYMNWTRAINYRFDVCVRVYLSIILHFSYFKAERRCPTTRKHFLNYEYLRDKHYDGAWFQQHFEISLETSATIISFAQLLTIWKILSGCGRCDSDTFSVIWKWMTRFTQHTWLIHFIVSQFVCNRFYVTWKRLWM